MDNILRISFHKDPLTLDPQKSGDPLSSTIIFLLFKGLTRFEENQKIYSDLADAFYACDNYKKYIFHLGEHYWSDNTPITSHDFIFSWKRALSPDFPTLTTNFFYLIKNGEKAKKGRVSLEKIGVYAKSDRSLIVELEHPCPYFPELTSFCSFFPVPLHTPQNPVPSIFSGAFQLSEWNKGKEIILNKNPYCKKLSCLEGIHIKIIPNEKESLTLFENDQLDWLGDPISPLPTAYLPSLFLNKKIKAVPAMTNCWFNTLSPPFSILSLRRALASTIPRKKLLYELLLSRVLLTDDLCLSTSQLQKALSHAFPCKSILNSFLPQSLPLASHLFSLSQEKENPFFYENEEIGKRQFREGLISLKTHYLKTKLIYRDTEFFSRLAFLLKEHWEALFPIRIQLEPLSLEEMFSRLSKHEFHICLIRSISQHTDIISFLERFEYKDLHQNYSGWENTQYQGILQQYRKTTNQKKLKKLAKEAQNLLVQQTPLTLLYYEHYIYLQKPYVQNLRISPIGGVHFDRVALQKKRPSFNREKDLVYISS